MRGTLILLNIRQQALPLQHAEPVCPEESIFLIV
jgi:hypothetical protein